MLDFASEWLLLHHKTQQDVARSVGLSCSAVSEILDGHTRSSVGTAIRVLAELGMSPERFVRDYPDTPLARRLSTRIDIPPYDLQDELDKWLSPERYGIDVYMCDGKEPRRIWI